MPTKGKQRNTTTTKKSDSEQSASTKSVPPKWPIFHPLVPSSDLSLQVLVPNQIILIPNFWTSTLCKTYVNFLSSLPLITTPGKPKKGEAVRVNDRFQIEDPAFAERLWRSTALKELVLGDDSEVDDVMSVQERRQLWGGEVVGLNPNIRIYKYSKGQFFAPHYDDSNTLTLPTTPTTRSKTTWTLLLYLTSPTTGCIGGETVFYPPINNTNTSSKTNPEPKINLKKSVVKEPVIINLQTGMALLHKHGDDCMLHEGKEVLEGEKWVVRSDLCVRL